MTTASLIRPTRCRVHHQQGPAAHTPSRRRTGQIVTGGPADRYQRAHRPVSAVPVRSSSRGAAAPNFVVRRLAAVVLAIAAVVAVVSVAGSFVAGFGGAPAAAAEAQPLSTGAAEQAAAHHVAQPGDTLWSIAEAHRGSVDHARYLDALIRLNGGTSIEVGQAVWLP